MSASEVGPSRSGRKVESRDRPGPLRYPQTVEFHLSNAYQKLGIHAREELAGALQAETKDWGASLWRTREPGETIGQCCESPRKVGHASRAVVSLDATWSA